MSVDAAGTSDLAELRGPRSQVEAVSRWRTRLAPVFVLLILLITFQTHPRPGVTGHGLVVSIVSAGLVAALVGSQVTRYRTDRWTLLPLALLIAASAVLMWAQPKGIGAVGVLGGVLLLARPLPGRAALGLSASALAVLASISVISGQDSDVWLLAVLAGLWGVFFLAERLAFANEEAERLVVELQESRAAEARAAGLAERQHLAREMHDVLAHSLSGLMLQLEGARMLAAENPTDPRLPQTIDRAHHLARSGLDEARRAIGMLRDDELPGPERLADLATQFETDRGAPCRLSVEGQAHPLGSEARLALYRVAQEALTNVAKHACPERVEVHLAYEPSSVRLTIEDFTTSTGTNPVRNANGGGYGLTGMRERAELLGGTLVTEATSHGFRVELDVPA